MGFTYDYVFDWNLLKFVSRQSYTFYYNLSFQSQASASAAAAAGISNAAPLHHVASTQQTSLMPTKLAGFGLYLTFRQFNNDNLYG
jgi:hypothetical protein